MLISAEVVSIVAGATCRQVIRNVAKKTDNLEARFSGGTEDVLSLGEPIKRNRIKKPLLSQPGPDRSSSYAAALK
jgi:hypothetical protein